jgi:hypothetical protein
MNNHLENNYQKYSIISKFEETVINKGFLFSYTEYLINIKTNLCSWQIKKRYSDFQKLHNQILERVKNLPQLPAKTIFNMNSKIISERKVLFEEYLNELLSKTNLWNFPVLMEFIEMNKELLILHSKSSTHIQNKSTKEIILKKKTSFQNLPNRISFLSGFNKTQKDNLDLIDDFLRNLENIEENKCSNVSKFWLFLTNSWPKFTKEEIMKLFYGDGINLSGLLSHCGKLSQNSIGSQSCLDLLCKLIKYEYNPHCETFLAVLKMGRLECFKRMKLEFHLKSLKNSVKENCFTILNAIINIDTGVELSKILNDENAEAKYNNWMGFMDVL